VNQHEFEIRRRIASLVESIQDDQGRSHELFQYVWTMVCVDRGLLRVIRRDGAGTDVRLVVEEVHTGRHRLVTRPAVLDDEIEALAVQALARILGLIKVAS
jgi:hypothetical protein